jgi:putative transposase
MAFNRMLDRTGHFWEARYHATAIRAGDDRHALATLAYVHANPDEHAVSTAIAGPVKPIA